MKARIAAGLFAAALLAAPGPDGARAVTTTLTFGDASGAPFVSLSASQYGGFNWSFEGNEIASINVPAWLPSNMNGWFAGVGCTPGGSAAGCIGAYNSGHASPTAISRAEPFILNQFDLTSSLGSQVVEVRGYRQGQLQFDQALALTEQRMTVVLNWTNIDQLRIRSLDPVNSSSWVMDNVTYTAPVPEPAIALYLLTGAGFVAAAIRRRRMADGARGKRNTSG